MLVVACPDAIECVRECVSAGRGGGERLCEERGGVAWRRRARQAAKRAAAAAQVSRARAHTLSLLTPTRTHQRFPPHPPVSIAPPLLPAHTPVPAA
jgi:hypothetical protein